MSLTRILFIGNSYTYCNDLPKIVEQLSNATGKRVQTAMVTTGGVSLEWHWCNPETLEALDGGEWDFVVLQDYSLQAVEAPEKMRNAVASFVPRIRNAYAAPLLYLTWARQHIPEMQDELNRTCLSMARQLDITVAPVGIAWRKTLGACPELVLHTDDGSHPNTLGSYLAACVFYATIFGESPVGLTNELESTEGAGTVIDEEKASFLQQMARESIQELG